MVTLHLPSCLDAHPREARLIGDLVIRYGELEWMLCRAVAALTGNLDATVKAMYRVRGELPRLKIADALSGSALADAEHAEVFRATLDAVNRCRAIRNSYAHAHWFDIHDGTVGFYDLEKLAEQKGSLDLSTMGKSELSFKVLADQDRYYAETLHNLVHLFYAFDARSQGRTAEINFIIPLRPPAVAQPIKRDVPPPGS
nr:hypothetical protein [uncultured Sphingomonas sp.]